MVLLAEQTASVVSIAYSIYGHIEDTDVLLILRSLLCCQQQHIPGQSGLSSRAPDRQIWAYPYPLGPYYPNSYNTRCD